MLAKGLKTWFKSKEPINNIEIYIVGTMIFTILIDLIWNVLDFFSMRSTELLSDTIVKGSVDPYADLRGGRKRNIYIV